jgi:hypothetical protein
MNQLAAASQRPQAGPCVAVVGSRDFADLDRVRRFVHQLPGDVTVLSGGARGVDRCAADTARARGLATLEFPANWERDGYPLAGHLRNDRIAERCDRMFAFWDGRSNGTHHAFHRALQLRRNVVLYRLRQPALVGTLATRPVVRSLHGALRADFDFTVVTSGSSGRPRTRVHHVAALGDLATALVDLRTGTSLRLRAALRQVFVTGKLGRLELRSTTAEARSLRVLALPTTRRALRSAR